MRKLTTAQNPTTVYTTLSRTRVGFWPSILQTITLAHIRSDKNTREVAPLHVIRLEGVDGLIFVSTEDATTAW
jgi:hypothetical protein